MPDHHSKFVKMMLGNDYQQQCLLKCTKVDQMKSAVQLSGPKVHNVVLKEKFNISSCGKDVAMQSFTTRDYCLSHDACS